ncbi:MAG TPA: signal recognition particle-docking protein FtsY [Pyrinomonadaceae bacterium]|jgi:fused signal recognition particle receptor|nr:signal recognition particle-docking protein FtsY [Pyrinomonadaceae bacterium]
MAFWKRKNKERYITLGLNESAAPPQPTEQAAPPLKPETLEPPAATTTEARPAQEVIPQTPALEPAVTGQGPTPTPASETHTITESPRPVASATTKAESGAEARPVAEPVKPVAQKPFVPSRSPFNTSVLGLNRSMEELQAEEAALEQAFANRFRRAVEATRESLSDKIDSVFQGRKQIDASLLDELEEALISADIGVPTTLHILETVRRGIARQQINDIAALKQSIKSELLTILQASERHGVASEASVPEGIAPYVMMIVGVNGVGKTTTIGKLAQRIKAEGNDVLICAADTFRAAASDQLAIWAERTGVPLIQQKEGTDPAAVLFDSLKAAKARASDVLIVDTAGRLHNKSNLMAELEKMKRIAGREVEGAPHETLLVVDAVTGQNGLEQARQFLKVAGVTGIVLTKLDGTAKGGIAIAIAKELNLPIRYAGIGEKVDDLVVFDPEVYVNSLFE